VSIVGEGLDQLKAPVEREPWRGADRHRCPSARRVARPGRRGVRDLEPYLLEQQASPVSHPDDETHPAELVCSWCNVWELGREQGPHVHRYLLHVIRRLRSVL